MEIKYSIFLLIFIVSCVQQEGPQLSIEINSVENKCDQIQKNVKKFCFDEKTMGLCEDLQRFWEQSECSKVETKWN